MTMLPTPDWGTPKGQVVILNAVPDSDLIESHRPDSMTPNIARVRLKADSIDRETVTAVDAFILHIDANLGLSPKASELWHTALDHDIPRCVVVTQAVNGRADFDEMVAIIQRVLEPDALVRYLPIETEDESGIAGAFDVLTNEIIQFDGATVTRIPGDPEHLELTATRRSDLLDALTYAMTSDETFDSHNQGLPIRIDELSTTYLSAMCVPIFFSDQSMEAAMDEWVLMREALWEPIVTSGDSAIPLTDLTEVIGIGIGSGLVRMFGPISETSQQFVVTDSSDQLLTELPALIPQPVLKTESVTFGQTVRNSHSQLLAGIPEF